MVEKYSLMINFTWLRRLHLSFLLPGVLIYIVLLNVSIESVFAQTPENAAPTTGTIQTPTNTAPTTGTIQTPTNAAPTTGIIQTPTNAAPTTGTIQTPTNAAPTTGTIQTPTNTAPTTGTIQTPVEGAPTTNLLVQPATTLKRDVITWSGDVEFRYEPQKITATAEKAEYYKSEQKVVLTGRVKIMRAGESYEAETATFFVTDEFKMVADKLVMPEY
jgi:hypothetical protein